MARDFATTAAKCPYYHSETGYVITCEGVTDGGYLKNGFINADEKRVYRNSFCTCDCWQGCIIAQMLNNR